MRLVLQGDQAVAVAVDDITPWLEPDTLGVRLDATSRLLDAVRVAANQVAPQNATIRESDPVRQAMVAQTILQVSAAAKALANAALAANPADANGKAVLGALTQLRL